MEHEGMVHALEEVQRLLKPDGCLIDIHPLIDEQFIEVHKGGKIVFSEPVPEYYSDDLRQAEDALAHVIQRQLFNVERSLAFDFLIYSSSVTELQIYIDEANAYDESSMDEAREVWTSELASRVEEAMRAIGEGAEVVYRERATISKLKS
jgi:hypothetical protein